MQKILEQFDMKNYKVIMFRALLKSRFGVKSYWESCKGGLEKPQAIIALGCVCGGGTRQLLRLYARVHHLFFHRPAAYRQ